MEPVLALKNITKRFPGVVANDQINFELQPGEIHALVGENGAGKSTLMKILFGIYQQDSGKIYYQGKQLKVNDPSDAIEVGIGMVHQHFMLVPTLTVVENIILGAEPTKGWGKLDLKTATQKVNQLSQQYNLEIDAKAKVAEIPVGMQQRVEILKALYRQAEVLILDEPTAVLTPQEVEGLYRIMGRLTRQGKSIIFITHKLKEVLEVSDRTTVLRDGQAVGTVKTSDLSEERLAEMMVGREVLLEVEKEPADTGECRVEVSNLRVTDSRELPLVDGVSFRIKAGEILGIAGVEGNGQTELVEALTGLREADSGSFEVNGEELLNRSARSIKEAKVGHIPEDRHKYGLVLDYSVADNLILGHHYQQPFAEGINLNSNSIAEHAARLIPEYDIRPQNQEALAQSLSGGNQQKVIVAREFDFDPQFLIAAQPTRGVDIGAIEFVHQRLIAERDEGKAVLLVSAELTEIMSLSDRIAVMYEGRIVDIVDASKATKEELGLLMAGGSI